MVELVTTTLPGDRGASRCEFCHLPLLVSVDRLPRLRSGEDARICDGCIPDALAACSRRSRPAARRGSRPAAPCAPAAPRPSTTGHIDRSALRRLEAQHPYWHLSPPTTSDQEAAHVHHQRT